ncbi:histidine phosphatase family protein [Bacillus niameyensis]|uniref:histidine phosphatase family protein n=1 Tax=Bacillus niameyensis TaxID=1522308 RepID=UPI0007846313|nr:histidine phosphatase family protein [Bacillus niameyensis]
MTTLFITRHGETIWNTEKRMQGWSDSALTESGIKNAIELGERLKNIDFKVILSSPSERTKATSRLIRGKRDIPILQDENLREINLGEWEGETLPAIKERYRKEFDAFWNSPQDYTPIGGETFEDIKKRAALVIKRIREEYPNGNVLIVTHSVMIKCLLLIFRNGPIEKLWEPPFIHDTSLTIVRKSEKGYQIILEGDTTHRKTDTK